jgi:hypothetical protein
MATSSSPPPRGWAQPDGAPPRTAPWLDGTLPPASTPVKANGRTTLDPAAVAKPGSAERRSKGESKA